MAKSSPDIPRTDRMFRAFSDRTRLRMLFLLQERECCVNDIVEILQIEQPSASRHLAYLRKARLVAVRKAGQWSYYSLTPACEPFHARLLECLACCFAEVPEIRADQVRAKRVREAGGCCPDGAPAGDKKVKRRASKNAQCCTGA